MTKVVVTYNKSCILLGTCCIPVLVGGIFWPNLLQQSPPHDKSCGGELVVFRCCMLWPTSKLTIDHTAKVVV